MPLTILITVFSLCVGLCAGCSNASNGDRDSSVARAFEQHRKDVLVEDEGVVSRVLSDDTSGRTHQRFIVRLLSGQTVLIEHNTDLAPRVEGLGVGDSISFSGEYVWNDKGGLVHWTHHDPAGRRPSGWIKHNGRTYR